MALKLGYKIVEQRLRGKNKFFISFNDGRVKYPRNEWAFPLVTDGPLTVLNSRKAARIFLNGYKHKVNLYKIFRCLYEPAKEDKVWQGYHRINTIKDLEKSCNPYDHILGVTKIQLLPGSTQLAKRVLIF